MRDRRQFLKLLAAGAAVTARSQGLIAAQAPSQRPLTTLRKSTLISMLPKEGTYAERFAIGREAGFEAIEMRTITRIEEAAEIREAAQKAGLRVHSVMNEDHWRFPISSNDPETVNKSVAGMEASIRNAALWGSDTVLLVPAVVDAGQKAL